MTAEDKQAVAAFLDLAEDVLADGHRTERPARIYSDDAASKAETPSIQKIAAVGTERDSLERVAAEVRACTACPLSATRKQAVPGEGSSRPLVMVIGEGPGADEDTTGRPFVGKAGQLLDKMLASVGLTRETNCFIANVVKCRPPNNRDPEPEEVAACSRFLERQRTLLEPKVILTVGRVPTQALLATTEGIGRLRGRFIAHHDTPLLPTYHPSALLRDESLKRPAWEDLKTLRAKLAELDEGYGRSASPEGEDS
jgi:DNA polymerase